jgi:hypothetical protein
MDIDLMAKKTEQVNVRMAADVFDGLQAIKEGHGLEPAEILRRCAEAVVKFHKENGFFSIPVHIEPEATFLQRARRYKSDADLPQVAGKDADLKQTPKPRKSA